MVAFVGELSSAVTTLAFNFILLDIIGNVAVAAYGVIANIAIVGTALLNGVAQGLQPLASKVHGEGDEVSEKKINRHALVIGGIIAVLFVVVVIVFSSQLTAMFNSEKSVELANYAEAGIKIYFTGFLIGAINIVRAGFYSATDRALESSIISVSRGIVAIILFAFALSKAFGITGIWMAFPASEAFTLVLSVIVIALRGKKKNLRNAQ